MIFQRLIQKAAIFHNKNNSPQIQRVYRNMKKPRL